MHRHRLVSLVVLALGLPATPVVAQQVSVADGISVKMSGRLHVQFNTTSVDSLDGAPLFANEILIRRARLTFDIKFNDLLTARVEPDYSVILGAGLFSLRDAYVRATFGPEFRATLGQFKRPFDVFELTSSSQILVIERTGAIRGVRCGELSATCSLSTLSAGLLYSDRDVGIMLDGEVGGRLRYAAALTNGQLQNVRETNSGKSVTGRVALLPLKDVVIAGNVAYKDYLHPNTDAPAHAVAWGADVEVGNFTRGLHIQTGVIGGDNWRVAIGDTAVARFLTGQLIATYKAPLSHRWIKGLEPVVRASWTDPVRSQADDDGWLVTPGVILHFGGRTMLHTNLDVWVPTVGDTEYAFRTQMNFYF